MAAGPVEAASHAREPSGKAAGSTLSDVRAAEAARRGRPWRMAAVGVLSVVVALGAVGALGVRSREASATAGGYQLSLTYPWVARAGLDVPWRVTVRRPGGFTGMKSITLAVTADYFDIFETQGFHPEPSEETRDGHRLYLTFAVPESGEVFVADFDTYVQPSAQLGRRARVAVVEGSAERVGLTFRTWLLP
jgi:hypothetical protein